MKIIHVSKPSSGRENKGVIPIKTLPHGRHRGMEIQVVKLEFLSKFFPSTHQIS